jgi:hypothetical protein
MQCGSSDLDAVDGRAGGWFVFHDNTVGAVQTPPKAQKFTVTPLSTNPADPDYFKNVSYSARTTGNGFTDWGAGVGFNLAGGMPQPSYDALSRGYTGVAFLARSQTNTVAILGVLDQFCFPAAGKCNPAPGGPTQCNDSPQVVLNLTPAWKPFVFHWQDVKAQGWGLANPQGFVDATALYNIQFLVPPNMAFDIEVTEVGFIK